MGTRSATAVVIAPEWTCAVAAGPLTVRVLIHIAGIVWIVVVIAVRAVASRVLSTSVTLWSLLAEWLLLRGLLRVLRRRLLQMGGWSGDGSTRSS